jgi:hypothetical protein
MNKLIATFFTIIFCLTSSICWSELWKDLVERDDIFYKKFTDVPFTGKIEGKKDGVMNNGKKEGRWISYYDNWELSSV